MLCPDTCSVIEEILCLEANLSLEQVFLILGICLED